MTLEQVRQRIIEEIEVDVKYKGRKRYIVETRALFCEICLKYGNGSLQQLAEFLGLKSHASILHYQRNDYFVNNVDYSWKEARARLLRDFEYEIHSEAQRESKNIIQLIEETRLLAINFQKILTKKQEAIKLCLRNQ